MREATVTSVTKVEAPEKSRGTRKPAWRAECSRSVGFSLLQDAFSITSLFFCYVCFLNFSLFLNFIDAFLYVVLLGFLVCNFDT